MVSTVVVRNANGALALATEVISAAHKDNLIDAYAVDDAKHGTAVRIYAKRGSSTVIFTHTVGNAPFDIEAGILLRTLNMMVSQRDDTLMGA